MNQNRNFVHPERLFVLLVPLFLLLAACALVNPPDQVPTATPEPTTIAVTVPPLLTETAPQVQTPPPPISQLRVWIPPEIGARTQAGSQILIDQLRDFEAAQSNLSITVEQKPVEGPGGILSYLRTGNAVAPSILPDLIALPTTLIGETGGLDVLYPLDDLISSDVLTDIYPAPAEGVFRNGRLYAVPFGTSGLTHLIYNPAVVTETVPLSWSQFISDTNHTLVLPVDGREGAMLGLQMYLAEGGTLINEAGQLELQVEPLTRALELISLNRAGLLQSAQMKTLDEAWQYYQLGLSEFVWTRSDFFLGQQVAEVVPGSNKGYLPVPGPSGPLIPLTNSWAWAVSTSDPARQVLSVELIKWLNEPANLAAWSRSSEILPAARQAMGVLAEQDSYFLFTSREMERAEALPVSQSSRVFDVIGEAVFQVLTSDTPPAVLAEAAATALRQ